MYHVTTRALDQGGVEPRLAVSLRSEGHRQYHYTTAPANSGVACLAGSAFLSRSGQFLALISVISPTTAYLALVSVLRYDSRPGPGGSRTAASCQPQVRRPSAIPLHHCAGSALLPHTESVALVSQTRWQSFVPPLVACRHTTERNPDNCYIDPHILKS